MNYTSVLQNANLTQDKIVQIEHQDICWKEHMTEITNFTIETNLNNCIQIYQRALEI